MAIDRTPLRGAALAAGIYIVVYSLAAYIDLWTTTLAISKSGAHEGNVFATSGTVYLPARALLINAIGAIVMTGCVFFAANHRERVEPRWLLRPVASFQRMYLNPWSSAGLGVSPLHMLSTAIAFLALRVLAAVNNLLICFCGFAPIGAPINLFAHHTSGLLAFLIVIVPLFYFLAIAFSPLAAKLLVSW